MSASCFLGVAAGVLLLAGSGCASTSTPAVAAVASAQEDVSLEGAIEVLIEDSNGSSRTIYALLTDDRRIPLRFATDPPNLTTGTRVRLRGRFEADGTFEVRALERL